MSLLIHAGRDELRALNDKNADAYVCKGKMMKFSPDDEAALLEAVDDPSKWLDMVEMHNVIVKNIEGNDYAFVLVRANCHSDRVLVPLPYEIIAEKQAEWQEQIGDASFDETDDKYEGEKARRDRAMRNCSFTTDLTVDLVKDWPIVADEKIKYVTKPLPHPEVEDSDSEDEKPTGPDEEEVVPMEDDRTMYGGKRVLIRQGRHVYKLSADDILTPVGKPIHCTQDEFAVLRSKSRKLMDEKLTYENPALLRGKDKDGNPSTMLYVHFVITDAPSWNDSSNIVLYNLNKQNLSGETGQLADMRKAVQDKGLDLADFPALSWKPADIPSGGQIHPPQTKMPPCKGVVLPPSEKKPTADAPASSSTVKRETTVVQVKEENKRQRLSKLPAGGDSVFVVPHGHDFVKLFTNSQGTHYSIFNPAEEDDEEEE